MKSRVVFDEKYAERLYVFRDRLDAGVKLGEWLRKLGLSADVVYAVPAGGVPVGLMVSRALGAKLDLVICRKLLIPWNREAGFGAVAPDGTFFYDEELVKYLGLTSSEVQEAISEQLAEVSRRLRVFRCGEPYREISGARVVVVDDGIAAGYTMKAAAEFLRKLGALEVYVAVPTCHTSAAYALARRVDAVYCLNPRSTAVYAVADAYQEWHDLDELEVLSYLRVAKEKGLLAYKAECI